MRATLNIPDKLIIQVQKISGEKSKTKAIVAAMEEFVKSNKFEKLLSLKGRVSIDYDWEKEEEIEMKAQKQRERNLER